MKTPKRIQPSEEQNIAITQIRSLIGRNQQQRDTLRTLGLKRIGHTRVRRADPATVGMVNAIPHLVSVTWVETEK